MAKVSKAVEVEAYKHDETRINIPTKELREFAPDEGGAKTLLRPVLP